MTLIIRPTTTDLTVFNVDTFLKQVPRSGSADQQICFDLRNLAFIDLFSMVALLYTCQELIQHPGSGVHLELSEEGACGFLPRVGFLELVPQGVTYSNTFTASRLIWEQAERGNNPRLLELTSLSSSSVIRTILDNLVHVLRRRFGYGQEEAYDMVRAFSEVCHNVLDHNDQSVAKGLAAMQEFEGPTGKFLHFVVGDAGIGIKTSLTRNPIYSHIKSDIEAILASTENAASESPDFLRGSGLPTLLELSAKHSGSVHIRSGSGRVYWRRDGEHRCYTFDGVPYLPGAQIAITYPARSKSSRLEA
jgi:anti-sigma regulatory factor (Ser/Thr protein kinase)